MTITNILVVEDERITAKDIKKSLEKVGYNVPAMVSTGEDAIKFSEENQPDLVIMDIKLEGEIDGIDAAKTIKAKFAIPVIYLTAYADESTIERAKSTNPSAFIIKEPYGFIHKPFEEKELYTAIDILYRKDQDTKLKTQDKLLSSVLKKVSDGVIATDIENNIKFMNSAAEKLTGIKEENSIGMNLNEIFPDIILKKDINSEVNLKELFKDKILLKSSADSLTSVEGTVTPIKDENGNNEGIILIFQTS
jgi:two-component system, response regulator PdtaR